MKWPRRIWPDFFEGGENGQIVGKRSKVKKAMIILAKKNQAKCFRPRKRKMGQGDF